MKINRQYTPYEGDKDKEFLISSFRKCVTEKREIDKLLESLITPYIKSKNLKILDACCGIGYISYFLSEISPDSTFLGIDKTLYLIEEGKKLCANKKNISFEIGDIYDLSAKFHKTFDITINWRVLSFIPYYDEMIRDLISVTKKHIFISSLFYDGDIDFEIKVREFKKESGKKQFNAYWNVYSYPHFKEFVYSLGAKNIEAYDFEIDIDVPKPPIDDMSSYTIRLENDKKLQVAGAVVLTWKIIRIDL